MTWILPKLDWLPEDYYNFEDLNRVESNTEAVAGLINILEVDTLPTLITKDDHDMSAIPLAEELNRIEKNIDILAKRYKPRGWQESKLDWVPNTPFNYIDAIRLESNLSLLHFYYKGNLDAQPRCGVFICGEEAV